MPPKQTVRTHHAPEPKGLPILGQLIAMRNDPLQLVVQTMCDVGGFVRLRLGPRDVYMITDPDCAQEILQTKHRSFTKRTFGMAQLSLVVGNGLVTSDGNFWRKQRRIVQPAFHHKRLADIAITITDVIDGIIERWSSIATADGQIDIDREMMASTLQVIGRTMLSTDLAQDARQVADALDHLLVQVRARMLNPFVLPLAMPTPGNIRFKKAVATIDHLLGTLIEERRSGKRSESDLLQMLIDAVDADTGESMSPKHLRDEVVTIFIAGHETTAANLSWTFYLLSKYPLVREKLREELDAQLQNRRITLSDLANLPYLSQVLDESMRLFPPAWVIPRQSSEDVEIGGYTIPADTTALISPYAIHRSPTYWENPLAFDPDRFSPERSANHHKYQFIPFGAGSRMCIGKGFAMMEAKFILATLVQRFTLDLVPHHPVVPQPAVTLRPANGIKMRLKLRS